MESESCFTTEGDIAYIRVRSPHGPVRSEEGLRDDDEMTGALVGADRGLVGVNGPAWRDVEALPRIHGRRTRIERQPA